MQNVKQAVWRRQSTLHRIQIVKGQIANNTLYCSSIALLAASGSVEHASDVLSTPSARLQVGSAQKAVVPRERRWLVALVA